MLKKVKELEMSVSVSQGMADDDIPKHHQNKSSSFDLDSIRAYAEAMATKITSRVSLDTIRPLHMFMGVTGHAFCFAPDAFAPPAKKIDKSTMEKFKSRLRLNFAFFLSNYVLVAALVAVVVGLMHPGMLFSLGLVWGLWMIHYYLISNEVVVAGKNIGSFISINHRSTALMILTIIVTVWKCLKPALTFMIISSLIILSHAIMRDPSRVMDRRYSGTDSDSEEEENSGGSEVLVEAPSERGDTV